MKTMDLQGYKSSGCRIPLTFITLAGELAIWYLARRAVRDTYVSSSSDTQRPVKCIMYDYRFREGRKKAGKRVESEISMDYITQFPMQQTDHINSSTHV